MVCLLDVGQVCNDDTVLRWQDITGPIEVWSMWCWPMHEPYAKPHLGHQRVVIPTVSGPSVRAQCKPELGQILLSPKNNNKNKVVQCVLEDDSLTPVLLYLSENL